MLVNHGCLSSEAPFIHSDALNTQSSVNFSTYAPSYLHYAVSTSTESPSRFYRHLPLPMDVSNTTNPLWQIPKTGVIARQQHSPPDSRASARTETNGGATEAREERNRPSVLFRSARAEGDRKTPLLNSEVESIEPCHTSGPKSPLRSDCQPNSPAESSSCSRGAASPPSSISLPKVRNWKKYKFIVLNSSDGANDNSSPTPSHMATESTNKSGEARGQLSMDSRSVKPSLAVWPVLVFDALFLNMVSCVLALQMIASKKRNQTLHFPTLWQKAAQDPQDQVNTLSLQCWNGPKQHSYMGGIWFLFLEILIFCQCQSHVSQNGHSKIFFS